MHEETLFHQALQKPPGDRGAFLDEACGGDDGLRRRLAALLAAHEAPGSFLAAPAADPAATADSRPGLADDTDGAPKSAPGGSAGRVGAYKLLQQIGEGGMGAVWMAEQAEPVRRQVALKLIKPGMDSAPVVAR